MAFRMEAEIIRQRKLIWVFVQREIKARYSGSILGVFWTIIHPLIMLAIYVSVIGFILGGGRYGESQGSGKEWFAIFLCCGLFPWNFISESFSTATGSITGNSSLIKRAAFPISILPVQAILSAFINFIITFTLFMLILVIFQLSGNWNYFTINIAWIPLFILIQIIFLLGPCYFLATLNVFFRDTTQLITAFLSIGFWITPIIYDPDLLLNTDRIPQALRTTFTWLCAINPFAHLVGIYQQVISKTQSPSITSILYLLSLSLITYTIGKYLFTRSQTHFVDDI